MNWWLGRIWLESHERMEDLERWPLKRLLHVHRLLDFKVEKNRIINEV